MVTKICIAIYGTRQIKCYSYQVPITYFLCTKWVRPTTLYSMYTPRTKVGTGHARTETIHQYFSVKFLKIPLTVKVSPVKMLHLVYTVIEKLSWFIKKC